MRIETNLDTRGNLKLLTLKDRKMPFWSLSDTASENRSILLSG